jgi:pimeloyl-ACP methyl ester carboxylesterase
MTDHTMWLDQLRGLGGLRRCVAIDLRGFGRSDPIVPGYLDYDRYADDVAEIVLTLREQQADVAGFSAGGTIALSLWQRHPHLVRSLVLMTPGVGRGVPAQPEGPAPRSGERGAPDYLDANARRAVFEGKAVLFDRFQVAGYHFGPHASLTARARYRSMFEGTRTDMMVATFQTLARGVDLMDVLPTISVPVLFIRGEDESMAIETLRELADRIPNARIAMVPRSGRFVMIENPEASTGAMRDFWQATDAATAAPTRGGTGS